MPHAGVGGAESSGVEPAQPEPGKEPGKDSTAEEEALLSTCAVALSSQ